VSNYFLLSTLSCKMSCEIESRSNQILMHFRHWKRREGNRVFSAIVCRRNGHRKSSNSTLVDWSEESFTTDKSQQTMECMTRILKGHSKYIWHLFGSFRTYVNIIILIRLIQCLSIYCPFNVHMKQFLHSTFTSVSWHDLKFLHYCIF